MEICCKLYGLLWTCLDTLVAADADVAGEARPFCLLVELACLGRAHSCTQGAVNASVLVEDEFCTGCWIGLGWFEWISFCEGFLEEVFPDCPEEWKTHRSITRSRSIMARGATKNHRKRIDCSILRRAVMKRIVIRARRRRKVWRMNIGQVARRMMSSR